MADGTTPDRNDGEAGDAWLAGGVAPERHSGDRSPPGWRRVAPAEPEASLSVSLTHDLPRRVGFWGASAVMVGIMIGGGIFQTPVDIARHLGSPWIAMAFWLAGGVLCLLGALAYAELSTMFPRAGGIYVFLREAYGDGVAFVFGWMYLLVTKPAGAAGVTFLFADHLNQLLGTSPKSAGGDLSIATGGIDPRFWTIAAILALTWINVRGVVLSARLAVVLTSAKFLALAAIVVLALIVAGILDPAKASAANFTGGAAPMPLLAAIPAVMAGVLWTYDGWSDAASVAGEVKHPQRTMPRVFIVGMAAVTAVYLAVNAVYFWLIPIEQQRVAEGGTLAPTVLRHLVGPVGGTIVTGLIVVSTLGSSHASTLANARVSYAQARDGLLFRRLGAVHPRFQTPHVSLWVGAILGVVAAWFQGSFVTLANTFVFTMWIFYALAAGAVIVLRVRRPDLARPYRCPGYPVVPALFVLTSLGMTVMSILEDLGRTPAEGGAGPGMRTLPWLGILAAGWPVYMVWKRVAGGRWPRS